METIFNWLKQNYIEVFAAISGFIYIYFSIREKIWLWLTGIITSAFYIYVYFVSKFYADMSLNVYYLVVSIYGWIFWKKGSKKQKNVKIKFTPLKSAVLLFVITLVLFASMGIFLDKFTDSPYPYGDAFTTALSITATYMLTQKFIEQWILWVIVDITSAVLYFKKGLYATVVLFAAYTILAIVGFFNWLKIYKKQNF